jgi:membrane protein DedA with SNARE-associated domain
MDALEALLRRFKYLAMFGVLFLCGVGLPVPEEVTLLASGLAVGWGWADFTFASIACVAGILAGDCIVFALGRYWGRAFRSSRATRWIFTRKRQAKVRRLFSQHRSKTVFLARFFAGLRIVVYAYAGQHGMSWSRFLLLDLLGALISGPTSIAIGWFAAVKIADPAEARQFAHHLLTRSAHWLYLALFAGLVLMVAIWLWKRYRERRAGENGEPKVVPRAAAREAQEDEVHAGEPSQKHYGG